MTSHESPAPFDSRWSTSTESPPLPPRRRKIFEEAGVITGRLEDEFSAKNPHPLGMHERAAAYRRASRATTEELVADLRVANRRWFRALLSADNTSETEVMTGEATQRFSPEAMRAASLEMMFETGVDILSEAIMYRRANDAAWQDRPSNPI